MSKPVHGLSHSLHPELLTPAGDDILSMAIDRVASTADKKFQERVKQSPPTLQECNRKARLYERRAKINLQSMTALIEHQNAHPSDSVDALIEVIENFVRYKTFAALYKEHAEDLRHH